MMDDERFNQLINGALFHPMPHLALTRALLALRFVVDSCGESGAESLESYCAMRDEQDNESVEFDL
jgi:hypothetical protein